MKAGDFSGSDRPIYDPLTGDDRGANRTPFPIIRIPAGRQDPIAKKIIALIPDPNLPGISNNYYASAPFQFDRHTIDSKVNWTPTQKLTTFVRFSVLHYETFNQQVFGPELGGQPISSASSNPGNGSGGTYSSTIGATYVFHTHLCAWMPTTAIRGRTPTLSSRAWTKISASISSASPGQTAPDD